MLLKLFFEFFKIGLFSVGGGMATLPFLKRLGESTGWFSASQLADMVAVSESTPGPIGINMATYTGYTVGWIPGSMVATLGEILPGIIIVSVIALFLAKFRNNRYVESAFYTVRPCAAGLIAAAGVYILTISIVNLDLFRQTGAISDLISFKALILAVLLWVFSNKVKATKKLHPILFIAVSALAGIVFSF